LPKKIERKWIQALMLRLMDKGAKRTSQSIQGEHSYKVSVSQVEKCSWIEVSEAQKILRTSAQLTPKKLGKHN
jgi:hypothetical protein